MSQFQPTKIKAAAQIQALPYAAVKGRKPNPFALMFTGAWTFNAAAGAWRPKMLTPSLQSGINQDGDDKTKLGANLADKAAKSAAVRVFLSGKGRALGRFADFLGRYPVKLRTGRIGAHYALANETYHADAQGRIYRKVDAGWLADLFAHVVKAGIVAPPSIADRDRPLRRLDEEIVKLTKRLERPGATVDALEIRRAELVKLRAAMIAAFAEQFPNAGEAPADLEPVNFGDNDGQDFPDGDADDAL